MCYPKPGPRCANHTSVALATAKAHLIEAKDKDEQTIRLAEARLMLARRDFYSTPTGQKKLQSKIAVATENLRHLEEEYGDYSWEAIEKTTSAEKELIVLKRQLENAVRLRTLQEKALENAQKDKPIKLSRRWKNTDIDQQWKCDNGDEIRVYTQGGWGEKYVWRIRQGQPIAMIHFFSEKPESKDAYSSLSTIEVNLVFRGKGLGVDTIHEVNKNYPQLRNSGTFSASGMRSLSAHLPSDNGPYLADNVMVFVDWQKGDLAN